jgi:hypothetical protein
MSRDYETETYPEDFEEAVKKYAKAVAPFWDKTRFPWKIALFFFNQGKDREWERATKGFEPLDARTLRKVER